MPCRSREFHAAHGETDGREFDQQVIDAVAHTNITLGARPSPSGWREPEPNPNRLFLAVEATHISIVYLRQTFDLLAKADPRLPVTFYEMLRQALSPWILCYDESAAEDYFDYRMENYEEEKAAGKDEAGLEKPQTIDALNMGGAPIATPAEAAVIGRSCPQGQNSGVCCPLVVALIHIPGSIQTPPSPPRDR
jgi:hypothetical protein